jgi:hypothetical protein
MNKLSKEFGKLILNEQNVTLRNKALKEIEGNYAVYSRDFFDRTDQIMTMSLECVKDEFTLEFEPPSGLKDASKISGAITPNLQGSTSINLLGRIEGLNSIFMMSAMTTFAAPDVNGNEIRSLEGFLGVNFLTSIVPASYNVVLLKTKNEVKIQNENFKQFFSKDRNTSNLMQRLKL